MKKIVNLLFEAKILKEIPRTGFHFLGSGGESVAEHSFLITFIAYVMSQIKPETDALKLISMCLMHDLPEARMGDLNYVQKKYATAHENRALSDLTEGVPFGPAIKELVDEFNKGESTEAKLARDADQLALILELKSLKDTGSRGPDKWLPSVKERLKTETGQKLAEMIMETEWDDWWFKKLIN
ncbi:putative hydrolases of HD superfamily [Candidatus Magnetomoraceae bacterium gMMP-15]